MKKKRKSIGRLSKWLEENLLFVLATFLLVFIPLYPKWPLFDVLPGYIVRVRIEDFLVAFVFLVCLIQVLRKKVKIFPNPLLVPIGVYLAVGLFSSFYAVLISKTVPFQLIHISKLVLHFLRRVEYMSLFFILYSAIKDSNQIKRLVVFLGITLMFISFYGFGQKFFGWPVYSTMNREFSKGWRLVLTEHARIPSTFAGHYDLAAYLAFFLTLFASLAIFIKDEKKRFFFFVVFFVSFFLLIYTASRTSFIAYLIGISVSIGLLALKIEKRKIFWGLSRWLTVVCFSFLVMFFWGGDLSERFADFLKVDFWDDYLIGYLVKEKIFGIEEKDLRYIVLEGDLDLVYSRSDQPPKIVVKDGTEGDGEKKRKLPPDVYEDIPDVVSTPSAKEGEDLFKGQDEATETAVVKVPRDYSPTAFAVGLSSAIRFDSLWPKAIRGFLKNPFFGSGYSTLTKEKVSDFTEAESTDNDYLRALGETGLFGFMSFFVIIALILKISYFSFRRIRDRFFSALVAGMMGGIVAILVNAAYIDVFEASKVAFTFWGLMAVLLVVLKLKARKSHV